MKTVGILGGSGLVGRVVAELLLADEAVQVVLLARNVERLAATAAALPGSDRLSTRQADATDSESLRRAFADLDLVIVAAPLLDYLEVVANACLETATDWLDVMLDTPQKWEFFDSMAQRFADAARVCLVGSGIHPGLPAVLIRAAAERWPITSAQVGLIFDLNWMADFSEETGKEFAIELGNIRAGRLEAGEWKQYSWMSSKSVTKVDFGPIGKRTCAFMGLEEIRRLPDVLPELRDAGLAVSGFSALVDYLVMPIALVMVAISKRLADPAAKFMLWALRRSVKPPYRTVMHLNAEANGTPIQASIVHPDSYWLTSAVAGATAIQILDGEVPPGVRPAALAVNPGRLLADLSNWGAQVILG
jgi:saccharopine dehydrogenase (NAD+, L-lysine-forming)